MNPIMAALKALFAPLTKGMSEDDVKEFNKGLENLGTELAKEDNVPDEMTSIHKAYSDSLTGDEASTFQKMSTDDRDAVLVKALAKTKDDKTSDKKPDELTDAQKPFFAKMVGEDAVAFMGMSSADRDGQIAKAGKAEDAKMVITKGDLDAQIAKSVGEQVTKATKVLTDDNEALKKSLADRDAADALSVLTAELKKANVVGAPDVAKSLLEVPEGAARDSLKKSLIGSAELVTKSVLLGESGISGEGDTSTAYGRLVELAKAQSKADNTTYATAFTKVYGDPANIDLVAEYKARNRPS